MVSASQFTKPERTGWSYYSALSFRIQLFQLLGMTRKSPTLFSTTTKLSAVSIASTQCAGNIRHDALLGGGLYMCYTNILDLSGINAGMIYNKTHNTHIFRRDFIMNLVEEMCNLSSQATPENDLPTTSTHVISRKRHTCGTPSCKNKSLEKCHRCYRFCCGKCTASRTLVLVCKCCPK